MLLKLVRSVNPAISNDASWNVENSPVSIVGLKRHSYCEMSVMYW